MQIPLNGAHKLRLSEQKIKGSKEANTKKKMTMQESKDDVKTLHIE